MEKYLVLATFVGSIVALLFALITGKRVLSYEEGTPLMSKISRSIREGANAYLRRQYTVVGIFFACMVVVLCVMAGCKLLTWFVPFAFLTGGFFSGLSGFVGMRIATKANCRTANACRDGLNKGLRVAFSAGSVMGFTVVGLGLLDISVWFLLLRFVFKLEAADITSAMLTFGMGASSMALFARVGGGIFTKAADVGADLVGKVEAGIPEDDPRNPAAIADNVTIIRDGSTVGVMYVTPETPLDQEELIRKMVGRPLHNLYPNHPSNTPGEEYLRVEDWTVHHPLDAERVIVDHANINVHAGEIVGLAGLMGAGRTEMAMSIFGHSYGSNISGKVFVKGKEVKLSLIHISEPTRP